LRHAAGIGRKNHHLL